MISEPKGFMTTSNMARQTLSGYTSANVKHRAGVGDTRSVIFVKILNSVSAMGCAVPKSSGSPPSHTFKA